mmetsp:Transcript_100719/g.159316  ORF Transcript_100719/g.159316 Transcript_100719/m.159316 type:complete len:84 (-) Transcript_100719:297-548(-)
MKPLCRWSAQKIDCSAQVVASMVCSSQAEKMPKSSIAVPGRATTRGAAARGVKGVAAYLPGCTDGSPLGCEDDYAADCSDDSH